jgi:hypothetical protein
MSLDRDEIAAETTRTFGVCLTTAFVVLVCAITYSCEMDRQQERGFVSDCLSAGNQIIDTPKQNGATMTLVRECVK